MTDEIVPSFAGRLDRSMSLQEQLDAAAAIIKMAARIIPSAYDRVQESGAGITHSIDISSQELEGHLTRVRRMWDLSGEAMNKGIYLPSQKAAPQTSSSRAARLLKRFKQPALQITSQYEAGMAEVASEGLKPEVGSYASPEKVRERVTEAVESAVILNETLIHSILDNYNEHRKHWNGSPDSHPVQILRNLLTVRIGLNGMPDDALLHSLAEKTRTPLEEWKNWADLSAQETAMRLNDKSVLNLLESTTKRHRS